MTAKENPADIVFWERAELAAIPPDEFMLIQDSNLLWQAELASRGLGDLFVPAADPYLAGRPASHCIHFGRVEALQHSYTVSDLSLVVVESSAFVLVRPSVDPGPPAEQPARAQRLAQALFRGASTPLQPVPLRARDESLRMTNMGVVVLGSIPGSIHAVVVGNQLSFLLHKPRDFGKSADGPAETGWLSSVLKAAWDADGRGKPTPRDPQPDFGQRGPRAAPPVDPADTLFWNRWRDESIDPAAFVPLATAEDERSLQKASGPDLERLLRPEASLYGTGRQHAFHASPDSITHRYDVGDLRLLVYENEQHVTVRVSERPMQGESGENLLGRVMGALLRRPLNWRFFEAKAEGEGMRFFGDLPADDPSHPLTIAGAFLTQDTPRGTEVIGLYFTVPRQHGPQGKAKRALLDDHLRSRWSKRGAP